MRLSSIVRCRRGVAAALQVAVVAALAAALPAPAGATDFDEPGRTDVQLTVESSRGDYGSDGTTKMINAPLLLRHRSGRWTVQAEVPFVQVESVERVVPGVGGVDSTPRQQLTRERGLGDIWLKLGFELLPLARDSTGVDVMLKVKTRSGDFDRGLGTGGTDIALQFEIYRILGPATGWAQVGWRRTGDVPGYRPYRDPWYGELGAFVKPFDSCQLGGYYSGRQPIGRLGSLNEITVFGACTQGGTRVQLYLTRGSTQASPEQAVGLAVRQRF